MHQQDVKMVAKRALTPSVYWQFASEKVDGSTLCRACKVSKRDLISPTRGQTEGRLALCSPAHRPVGGPNDQWNPGGWVRL